MPGRFQLPVQRLTDGGQPINAILREVRQSGGVSLDVLATRTNFSKPYLSNVESGRRRVTVGIADAYDRALGTGGLLVRLFTGELVGLVGRDAELVRLRRLVMEVAAGRGRAVWVEGEPGIGKSALLAAGLEDAARSGCRVLWAAADESLSRFPLWVLLECLREQPERGDINELLRGTGGSGLTPGEAVLVAAERLLVLVERWCAVSPVVLVVDDMQWADEVSLSGWERLRRLVPQVPLLLVGACRPVPRRPEVAALRRAIGGSDGVVLSLASLSYDQVTTLASRWAGGRPGPALRHAAEQAGGNPLYLRELIDTLVREERLRVEDDCAELVGPAVPRSLGGAISARLDFLSRPVRQILQVAALLGPGPTLTELSVVTGTPASELAAMVEEAILAGVLNADTTALAFRHGTIRAALYDEIAPGLRVALHQHAARALAGAGSGVEVVAEQLLAGGDEATGTGEWAVDWLVGGAGAELIHRAPQVAVDVLERVLERTPHSDPRRERLAAYRVSGLFLLGRYDDVVRLAGEVLAGAPGGEVAGQTAWALAYAYARLGRQDRVREMVEAVLRDRPVDPVWAVRLRVFQAMLSDGGELFAEAHRALAEAERIGDRVAIGYALHTLSIAYHRVRHDEKSALEAMDRAIAVIGASPETAELHGLLLSNRMSALNNQGRLAQAQQVAGEAVAAAERSGSVPRLVATRVKAADLYFTWGRWDDACAELAAVADHVGPDVVRTVWRHAIGALIAVHRDDRAALDDHLSATAGLDLDSGEIRHMGRWLLSARAFAAEADGRRDEALDGLLAACVQPGSALEEPVIEEGCRLWLTDVVRLAVELDRPAVADGITRACVADSRTDPRPETAAVALHCQGLVAADPVLVGEAVDTYERGGFVLFRAQALENRAVLLARRGNLTQARSAAEQAAALYGELNAAWDLRRARERLRRLGLRPGWYRTRGRPATGWEALTATELKVAALVAEGLSNPDIAARLLVSRRTVETHVAHALAKLGGHARIDIVRAVAEHKDTWSPRGP